MKSHLVNVSDSLAQVVKRLIVVGLICALFACAKPEPEPEPVVLPPPPPQFLDHTVRFQGETLGLIAKWYTGESSNWKQIVEANPGLRPERINMGDVISIPTEIVTREEEMPKNVVGRRARTRASAPVKKTVEKKESTQMETGVSDSSVKEDAKAVAVKEAPGKQAQEKTAKMTKPVEDKSAEDLRELEEALEDALGEEAVSKPAPVKSDADSERQKLLDELLSE